jgi:hypothetical protein
MEGKNCIYVQSNHLDSIKMKYPFFGGWRNGQCEGAWTKGKTVDSQDGKVHKTTYTPMSYGNGGEEEVEGEAQQDLFSALDEAMDHVDLMTALDSAFEHVELISALDEAMDHVDLMAALDEAKDHVDLFSALDEAKDHVDMMTALDEAMDHVDMMNAIDEAIDFVHKHKHHHDVSTPVIASCGALLAIGAGFVIKNKFSAVGTKSVEESLL